MSAVQYTTSEEDKKVHTAHLENDEKLSTDLSAEKAIDPTTEASIPVPVSHFAELSTRAALRVFWKVTLVGFAALFTACSDGFQFSLPGSLIAESSFVTQFGSPTATGTIALGAQSVATWAGVYSAGYISVLLVSGYCADILGRRISIGIVTLLMIAACLVEMFAVTPEIWSVAKLLNGFSIGLAQMSLTTYVSEIAPVQLRGTMLIMYSFWFAFGQLCASIANYIIQSQPLVPRRYLRVIYSEWLFSGVALLIVVFVLPETPRWYLRKGNTAKAEKSLRYLYGGVEGYDVTHELSVMKAEQDAQAEFEQRAARVSYLELFKGSNLRRTIISFSILGWQQLVGIPVVFGYNSLFFKQAGLTNPFLGSVIISILLLVFVFLSGGMVEKFGRRTLLLTGGCIMVPCLAGIGGLGFAPAGPGVGGGIVALMAVWVVAYAVSAGPCGYLFLGETSSPLLRAKTAGFAAACSGIFGLIFSYTTPLMLLPTGGGRGWGIKTAFLYAGTGTICAVLMYFFVPEHAGRTFSELDELYIRRIPARKFKTTETQVDIAKKAGSV